MPLCEFCNDTGKVPVPLYNHTTHQYEYVGEQVCLCKLYEKEYYLDKEIPCNEKK